jgi:hypothetical protein
MKLDILPKTKLGKWAAGLAAAWPVFTIVGLVVVNTLYPGVEAGNGLIDDLRVRPLLAITMLLGIAFGAASFPASLVAIFRKGERSLFSILAALLGSFLIILLIGEIFIEH